MSEPRVFIIDALNYIFRAFYAVPEVASPSGMPKNAILGYTRTLLRILKEHQPDYMVAAFEGATSFRHGVFENYKANRAATPQALSPQIKYCRAMTEAMGIPTLEAEGFEADDVMGTIAMRMWSRGYPTVIVSGDKDLAQLVRPGVCVYDLANEVWMNEAGVRKRFGVEPHQIPDLLALRGDDVDNIPGVPGVGTKTAQLILSACSDVEVLAKDDALLDSVEIRSRSRIIRRILDAMDTVRMSRKLATIRCDAPLEITPDSVRYRRGQKQALVPLCNELGFTGILEEIPMLKQAVGDQQSAFSFNHTADR
jgi:5'-3' exonuclease